MPGAAEEILPPGIQFTEHIVKENHRRLPAELLERLRLRQLDSQHNRPLLPL